VAPFGNEIVQVLVIGGAATGLFGLLVWRLQRRIFDELASIGLSIVRRDRRN